MKFNCRYQCRMCDVCARASGQDFSFLHLPPLPIHTFVDYTPKLLPHPHDSSAFGLKNWKPPPISSVE